MVVDVHAHFHPRVWLSILEDKLTHRRWPVGWDNYPHTDSPEDVDGRLRLMDEAGVDQQVLSVGTHGPFSPDAVTATEAARVLNDAYANLVALHPSRFLAAMALPLPHIAASLAEMERSYSSLGAVAINLPCSVFDRSLADASFDPLYEELDRRGAIVIFHPIGNALCSPLIRDFNLTGSAGNALEDGVLAMQLVQRKIPSRFPRVTFIIPHLGSFLPMLLGRMDHVFARQQGDLPELPSSTARRFFYDTVGHASASALTCACEIFGPRQLLPGSDWPIGLQYESYPDTIGYIAKSGLEPEDVELILRRNAEALFGL
jgi:predicted TIM-barrel fold metal-dependent hydrolase